MSIRLPAHLPAPRLPGPVLAADESGPQDVVFWSIVLLLLLVAGFWVVLRLKRRLSDDADHPPSAGAGFTLSDLRRMHREGQMSDAEFERAKAKIVEAARRTVEAQEAERATKSKRT